MRASFASWEREASSRHTRAGTSPDAWAPFTGSLPLHALEEDSKIQSGRRPRCLVEQAA